VSVADDDTAPAPAVSLKVGDVVARYRIDASIGGGGMGVVYRATDTTLGRTVALKFLAPQLAGAGDARARLLREARAASALDHPHIGVVYEVGEHAGGAFIAMAFYEGETLKERIARGALPVDEVERYTRQLAGALQAAHAAGIAHRDIKPANVLIARDGGVKLVDFGVAKLLDEATAEALTASGTIIGTLMYMAPEQLRGEGADARADLWALGNVAYEMLTGRAPFARGDRAATITAILTSEPEPVDKSRAVPASLVALVHALLEKDPKQRLGSAGEVISVLDQTAPAPRRRPARRRWVWPTIGVVAFLSVATPLVFFVVYAQPHNDEAAPQSAEDRARIGKARELYERGTREFELGRFDDANRDYEQAYIDSGDPSLLFNAAQTIRLSGRAPERAAYLYRRFLEAMPNAPNRKLIESYIEKLDAQSGKTSREAVPPRAAEPTPSP
jgi:serine/threonine-protein kinase